MRLIDLTRKRFGRLRVTGRSENDRHGKPRWNVVCDCGEAKAVSGALLRAGKTTSCGCVQQEASASNLREFRAAVPDTTPYIPHDAERTCEQCGLPFIGRYNQRYHPECYPASRTRKRQEQRVGKPEHQAASLGAELEKRNEAAHED